MIRIILFLSLWMSTPSLFAQLYAPEIQVKQTSNNSVGIGIPNPQAPLQVAGQSPGGTVVINGSQKSTHFNYGNGNENTYIRGGKDNSLVYIADDGPLQRVVIGGRNGALNRGTLTVYGGAVMEDGSNIWVTSDRKLKKNIKEYKEGLSKIKSMNIVSYNYTQEATANEFEHIGVIAQELQKVAPHLVKSFKSDASTGNKDKFGIEIMAKDAKEFLAVDTNGLTFLLINAIKEQQSMIEILQKEVSQLKKANSE